MASKQRPGTPPKRGKAKVVTVASPRPIGMIIAAVAVALVAIGIIGYTAVASWRGTRPWDERLGALGGVQSYKAQPWLTSNHKPGSLKYQVNPSVGGDHNAAWQNCTGDIYDAPIAAEHATHSLEHGAVWVTYRPGLAADQIQRLSERVRGNDYTFMSPQPGLSNNISLQAWGFQLTADTADDGRIDEFLASARTNAGPEQGAPCSGGITSTGTTPQNNGG